MGARASRPHPFAHPVISLKIDRAPTIPTAPHRHSGEGRNPEGRGEGALRFHPLMWPSQGHSDSGEELAPYPDTRPESRGARRRDIPLITKITVQTTPFAPLRALRGQSPSFQPPTRHSGGGRNPEGRGRGESHQSHESQFRQPPSRPFAPFVDNPRHSNRPTPSFRRRPESRGAGTWGIPPITKITKITVQTTPFAPLVSFVDNPRHSNRPPVIPAKAGIQRGGDVGNPTNHKNHSSDNPLPALSRPSWTIPVIPTAHPSFRRRPESRGAGTWGIPPITKITRITVQTTPFPPLRALRGQSPSFQPPTRHSGGGRNPGARRRDITPITKIPRITVQTTPFAPLSVLRGQSPSFQPPTRHSGGGRNPEGRGRGESHQSQKSHESQFRQLPSRP